jgi:hypothetical protein
VNRWGYRRGACLVGGALSLLIGVVLVAGVMITHDEPTEWLDRNLEPTGAGAWLSQDPPLVTADRLARAVGPRSRVVSSWGVALRYARGTVTVVAGPREGSANVYWDAGATGRNSTARYYRFGRYGWGGDDTTDPDPNRRRTPDGTFSSVTPDADVRTRRGEDFRGGGPGGGK